MTRRLQLTALTCVTVLLMAGATPAAARLRLNFTGPDAEWSDDLVQTSVTGSVGCGLTPGTAQALNTLTGSFRLTDIVIANPSLVAEGVTISDVTGPRLTVVVPPTSTFTDTFKVTLVLAAGPVSVTCISTNAAGDTTAVTLSGKLDQQTGQGESD